MAKRKKRAKTDERVCLGCDCTFDSTDIGNRICPKCKSRERYMHGSVEEYTVHDSGRRW